MAAAAPVPARMTVAYQKPETPGSKVLVAELSAPASVEVPSLDKMPPGTLLVKVLVTSICGSDLAGRCCATCAAGAWRGYTDEMPLETDNAVLRPGGTGHEVLGEVVEGEMVPDVLIEIITSMDPSVFAPHPKWLQQQIQLSEAIISEVLKSMAREVVREPAASSCCHEVAWQTLAACLRGVRPAAPPGPARRGMHPPALYNLTIVNLRSNPAG